MITPNCVTLTTELETFLKEEGIYDEFCENTSNLNDWDNDDPIQINHIAKAFHWSSSPEGNDFWSKIDVKFRNR